MQPEAAGRSSGVGGGGRGGERRLLCCGERSLISGRSFLRQGI